MVRPVWIVGGGGERRGGGDCLAVAGGGDFFRFRAASVRRRLGVASPVTSPSAPAEASTACPWLRSSERQGERECQKRSLRHIKPAPRGAAGGLLLRKEGKIERPIPCENAAMN